MTTKTVLTDEEIWCEYHRTYAVLDFARAIEQAILQSPEIQALKRDKERLDWMEEQTKKSYTGISFDYHRHIEDGYVVEHGYRFICRYFASGLMDSLRKAIDAAMENKK